MKQGLTVEALRADELGISKLQLGFVRLLRILEILMT